ncbi:MAG: trypsin-like peptidase domain-containing protein [Bacteroidia bacterium]|nr:trypsin-like peptidase domain-containing protein [Bacteroidia bacterium]
MKHVWILLILLIFFTILNSCYAISPDTIRQIKSATVYIEVIHDFILTGEEVKSSGSGFFITPKGNVITNYHVIQPMVAIYGILFPAPVNKLKIYRSSGTADYKVYDAFLIDADKANDLALLGLKQEAETPFLKADFSTELVESSPVSVFGYPYGEEFSIIQRGPEVTIASGFITSLRHDDMNQFRQIQVDAVVKPGNSGGPLINNNGKVIGIINMSYDKDRMNFAIPAYLMKPLISEQNTSMHHNDTVEFSANGIEGSSVFLDWLPIGKASIKGCKTTFGWHNISFMKRGYTTWTKDICINNGKEIISEQIPVNEITVSMCDTTKIPAKAEGLWQKINAGLINPVYLISFENFENTDKIQNWKQNTGGTDKHTWYIEDGVLHQYESDGVLHAISFSDSSLNNYMMRAKIKIEDEHDDSRAGLIFRETDDGFYLFRIHKESNKAQLAYHSKSPFGWFVLKEKELDIDITDKWFTLDILTANDYIACFIDETKPEPWYFNEAGTVQRNQDINKRITEFTKYNLADFSLKLILSFDKPNENSLFEFIFRKTASEELALRFSKPDNYVQLIHVKGKNEKVLKKETLPEDFFTTTTILFLIAKNETVTCSSMYNEIISYKNKNLLNANGHFGFACSGQKTILHQMTVASVE